jgi:uncharacterized damage-inducible protein DinB
MNDSLHALLHEANFDDWESVRSTMARTGPRVERLLAHILETKRMYWTLIAEHGQLEPPPATLEALLHYELEAVRQLDATQLAQTLEYSGRSLTVAQLIRLSARHSMWHAGQIALSTTD